MKLMDISHTINDGMITYKGLPPPVISDYLSREQSKTRYEAGTEFQIGKIEMVANTGTYIDSPFHRYPDKSDLAALDLTSIANLNGVVVHPSGDRAVTQESFAGIEIRGKAILIHTGWDQHWRTDEYSNGQHPYLTAEAAAHLVANNAALVGIDSFNIDDTAGGARPAHTLLLAAGIPIVEHLCRLSELPDRGFKFFAVPPKVKGFGSFPVRAFGVVE